MVDFDEFTEFSDISVFKYQRQPTMSFEGDENVLMDVTFEMDFDLKHIQR